MMPTTESNCRTVAAAKGFSVDVERGHVAVRSGETGQLVARCDRWSEALKFVIGAPRIDRGPGAA